MSGVLGGVLGGVFGLGEKLWQTSEAIQESKRAREFFREMSNTAIQRQVADMRAAGINPVLAARMGGASSPGMMGASMPGGSGLASGMMAGQSMQLMAQQVHSARTQAAIDKGSLELFRNNPVLRQAASAANLAHRAGAGTTGSIGLGLGGAAKQAIEWLRKQARLLNTKDYNLADDEIINIINPEQHKGGAIRLNGVPVRIRIDPSSKKRIKLRDQK